MKAMTRPIQTLGLIVLCAGLASFATPANAVLTQGTITVTDSGDGNGASVCTLREAIALIEGSGVTGNCVATGSASPPKIVFALALPATIALTSQLQPSMSMDIAGPGMNLLTLDGSGTDRIIEFENDDPANMTISDLSMTHGVAPDGYGGGAIATCCGHVMVLKRVRLSNNATNFAGGAIHAQDQFELHDCIVEDNRAIDDINPYVTYGGGISAFAGGITIDHTIIRNNTVGSIQAGGAPGFGGGVYVKQGFSGTATITGSSIFDNHALAASQVTNYNPLPDGLGGQGGGIANTGTLVVRNSTVSGNMASFQGAGILNVGTTRIINSTIAQNAVPGTHSPSQGGGIFNAASSGFGNAVKLYLTNATVFDNSAASGGGLFNLHTTAADVQVNNSAFGKAGNGQSGGDIVNDGGAMLSGQFNLLEDASHAGGMVDGVAGNHVGHPAQFGPLYNYGGATKTVRLAQTSPAVDAGNNALAVDEAAHALSGDQRDEAPIVPRIYNGTVDIGAFEVAHEIIFIDGFD